MVSFLLEDIYPCLKDKNRLFDLALDVTDVPEHGEAKLWPVNYFLDLERHWPHEGVHLFQEVVVEVLRWVGVPLPLALHYHLSVHFKSLEVLEITVNHFNSVLDSRVELLNVT